MNISTIHIGFEVAISQSTYNKKSSSESPNNSEMFLRLLYTNLASRKANTFKLYYVLPLIEQRRFELIYFPSHFENSFLICAIRNLLPIFSHEMLYIPAKARQLITTQVGCLTKGHGGNWTSRPKTGWLD